MDKLDILFVIYISFFIVAFILTGVSATKNKSFILSPQEWVQLIIGSLMLGIFMGLVRANIFGLSTGDKMFTYFASFFFFWFLLTKFFSNMIFKFSPNDASISKNVA
jgi:hypothetical protein